MRLPSPRPQPAPSSRAPGHPNRLRSRTSPPPIQPVTARRGGCSWAGGPGERRGGQSQVKAPREDGRRRTRREEGE